MSELQLRVGQGGQEGQGCSQTRAGCVSHLHANRKKARESQVLKWGKGPCRLNWCLVFLTKVRIFHLLVLREL